VGEKITGEKGGFGGKIAGEKEAMVVWYRHPKSLAQKIKEIIDHT